MPCKIIPTMRYRDAPMMIDWLCDTLGFVRHLVVEGDNGRIEHAQLVLGDAMIMLGSERDDAFGKLQKAPLSLGATTQSPYVVVPDADAVYVRVKAAGGRIVFDIKDEAYGGRGFSFLDSEQHLWNIGTYDPWS